MLKYKVAIALIFLGMVGIGANWAVEKTMIGLDRSAILYNEAR